MKITLQDISKHYSEQDDPAVAEVSATIESGEFFFLLGPSGCGKTTLLRLIAGLIEPSARRILFDDQDVTSLSVDKRGAAMVFQGYALWPHMTVRENVEFGPRMQGASKAERERTAHEQLERVQMAAYAQRKPNQLSGGQQQRVALARALAAGTRCVLFDEPLSNLDAQLRLQMRDELKGLVKSTGVTGIYVTHDQKEALSMADRVAVMNAGKIVQLDTPEAIYNQPATRFVADFLGEANFVTGAVVAAGATARVATPLGELSAADPATRAPGAAVEVCVRPEHVSLVAAGAAADAFGSAIPATVVAQSYLGDLRQYLCRCTGADGVEWRVVELAQGASQFGPGDDVLLTFAPQHVALLDAG